MTRLQELTIYYENEKNWPPMNDTTRRLWRIMSAEARARTMLASREECHNERADGRTENDPKARYNTIAAP